MERKGYRIVRTDALTHRQSTVRECADYGQAMLALTEMADCMIGAAPHARLQSKESMLALTGGRYEWPEWYRGEGWYLGHRLVFRRTIGSAAFTAFGNETLELSGDIWAVVPAERA